MYSPIGVTVAHMRQDAAGATLTASDGKEYHGEHITQLARKVLGYELPLEGLQYWVRGLPWPGLDKGERQVDETGRLKQIQQGPWQVEYLDWSPAGASGLPSKLDLTGEGLRMRLVVDEWKINTATLR